MDLELKPGDTVVFTGLTGLGANERPARFKSVAAECGLRVTTAVSGKTTLLVAAYPATSTNKAMKARSLGTPIVDYPTYLGMLRRLRQSLLDTGEHPELLQLDPDFRIEDGVLVLYIGTGGDVVIPASVTCVGDEAFSQCTSVTSVNIPDSVTTIGERAFFQCTSLTSVTIPDSVIEIGWGAFDGCTSLTSVTIPDSVQDIGDRAFSHCTSLTSVTIPSSVVVIGDSAFSSCASLTSVMILSSATSIGDRAFAWCHSLSSATISGSVTSVGSDVFEGCSPRLKLTYRGERIARRTLTQWVRAEKQRAQLRRENTSETQ